MEARELKFAIFKDLCGTRELGRWKRYWGAFQKYMRLQLSLGELHAMVASELSPRQRRLHNRLVVMLLSRAHASAAMAKESAIGAAPSTCARDDLADPPTDPTTADDLLVPETHEHAIAMLLGIMANEPQGCVHDAQATTDLTLACPTPRPLPVYDATPAPFASTSDDETIAGYRRHAPSGGFIYAASIPPCAEGAPVTPMAMPLEHIMQQAALHAGLQRVDPEAVTAFATASYMENVADALLSHASSSPCAAAEGSPSRTMRIAPKDLVAATTSHPQLMHPTAPIVRERATSAIENRF
ncbi:hypothetical protein SPRG_07767 [Saprolegnia parasitica CBS 223.65]|uniref:Uncharacterized protein n=1 Tax=Saprolegnia parasitica (strain CBS 223.65) TaxID=695850 RepID=A0A067CKG6_SAPPC|nr:hypothetical protein SPRG_07767 [Saprolegnia parasitica CBS 223.65]KDO27056.1 hypothetical protein SPRG_07767 [Saprolegnia parasitica CBS 223.65]|eukprot:XP_012202151.1 hypothetical protein SPRG_07767 [Saprolegnia parasitica CBS 223.65]